MNASHATARLASVFGLSLLLLACDSPVSNDEKGNGNNDSLNAELGKDQLNKYDFLQGKVISTGQALDLAIDGSGLFILKNQDHFVYFRRPANFVQDQNGALHLGNALVRLQGLRLFSDSNPYPILRDDFLPKADLKDLEDIRLPLGDIAPPRTTTVVKLARNLDSDAMGKGSILYTQAFLHHAESSDLLIGLMGREGDALGIRDGDIFTLSAVNGGTTVTTAFTVSATSTLADLLNAMTAFLRSAGVGAGLGSTVDIVTVGDSETLRGALTVYGNSAAISNFQVTSNRPVSGPKVTRAFALPGEIKAGTTRLIQVTETLRSPAVASDPLFELNDAVGNTLGLESGDRITISGSVGDDQAQNVAPITYSANPAAPTRMQELLKAIQENFKLADRDGTVRNYQSVSLNAAGSDDNIKDGSIVIRGAPEAASDIRDVTLFSTDLNNSKPSPNFFNTNMAVTTLRSASDALIGKSILPVHDATGKSHSLTLRFIPTAVPGSWLWEASMVAPAVLKSGFGGKATFGQDGSLATFTTDGGVDRLTFDPGNGSAPVSLRLDAGGPGDFTGMTQFRTETTFALVGQDGFAAGTLKSISIGEDGLVSGYYSNGQNRVLYYIPLADFQNLRGLRQVGDHSFLESTESGKPKVNVGMDPSGGAIRAGALEYRSETERTRICDLNQGC